MQRPTAPESINTSGSGPQTRVDTDKEQPQIIAEEIGDAAVSGCLEIGSGKAHRKQVRKGWGGVEDALTSRQRVGLPEIMELENRFATSASTA